MKKILFITTGGTIASSEGELDYDLLSNQDVWKDVV